MHSVKRPLMPLLAAAMIAAPSAFGFVLIGPPAAWQTTAIGYLSTNSSPPDIGGPMELNAFYRWNVTNITYAFDQSFIDFFGTNGMKAVDDVFTMLNQLPQASSLDINQYPMDTRLFNPVAQQARLLDVKTWTMAMMMEQLGLGNPMRYCFTIYRRAANANSTNYVVRRMNIDPDSFNPTNKVNDIYYTYRIVEANGVADAVESVVTHNDGPPWSAVAGGGLPAGYAFGGLTRDDVAGLKFLLSTNTLAIEGLIPGAGAQTNEPLGDMGWIGYNGSTNVSSNFFAGTSNYWSSIFTNSGTNGSNFITVAIRGGVNKIRFTKVGYDSLLGTAFTPITNYYSENIIYTNKLVKQKLMRVISQPDIVFVADHLGFQDATSVDGSLITSPISIQRTDTATWINDDALNGRTLEGGPGLISPPGAGTTNAVATGGATNSGSGIVLSFNSDMLPTTLYNYTPVYLDEQNSYAGAVWGTFDNTATPPIVYPVSGPDGGFTVDGLLAYVKTIWNLTNTLQSP